MKQILEYCIDARPVTAEWVQY